MVGCAIASRMDGSGAEKAVGEAETWVATDAHRAWWPRRAYNKQLVNVADFFWGENRCSR